jgi:hypothetical protein
MRDPEIWLLLFVFVLPIVALWRVFTKAGEAGWKAIIPIWNLIVLLRIAGRPVWWIVLLLIPFVSIVIWIVLGIDVAHAFGKGGGFALGLILLAPIFLLILGFGSARFVGPGAAPVVGRHGPGMYRA